jgi:hypothetical protein
MGLNSQLLSERWSPMREHVEFDRSYIAEQNAEKSRLHGQHFGYMKYAITKKRLQHINRVQALYATSLFYLSWLSQTCLRMFLYTQIFLSGSNHDYRLPYMIIGVVCFVSFCSFVVCLFWLVGLFVCLLVCLFGVAALATVVELLLFLCFFVVLWCYCTFVCLFALLCVGLCVRLFACHSAQTHCSHCS